MAYEINLRAFIDCNCTNAAIHSTRLWYKRKRWLTRSLYVQRIINEQYEYFVFKPKAQVVRACCLHWVRDSEHVVETQHHLYVFANGCLSAMRKIDNFISFNPLSLKCFGSALKILTFLSLLFSVKERGESAVRRLGFFGHWTEKRRCCEIMSINQLIFSPVVASTCSAATVLPLLLLNDT